MSKQISIDPITRIEGHLAIRLEIEDDQVVKAYSSGEMFRGFEAILKGRDPLDAQQITQRICGVCPIAHGTASILAQEQAYGLEPPVNGRLLRNMILGANYIQSHILHFYHLCAMDFVDLTAVLDYQGTDAALKDIKGWVKSQLSSKSLYPGAPFLPRYESRYLEDKEINIMAIKHYLDALHMRSLAHEAATLFCGKMPHATALVPGGVTEQVTAKKISAYLSMTAKLQTFINEAYIPDVLEVAAAFPEYFTTGKGCGNFLAYGVFPEAENQAEPFFPSGVLLKGKALPFDETRIREDVGQSYFKSSSGLPPAEGRTEADPDKEGAYSWIKAPRYDGKVMEVGPLARILIAYHKGKPGAVNNMVDQVLARFQAGPAALDSVMGRHAARAIECKLVADRCREWANLLVPDNPTCEKFTIPEAARGIGLTEAPRGALGHWLEIGAKKIENYQCVVPTTWNCSPRDDRNQPGAVEQSVEGTRIEDKKNPIEATRVVRSFDPCIACAVH